MTNTYSVTTLFLAVVICHCQAISDPVLPARCSENINCAACVTNTSCAWCTLTGKCLESNEPEQCLCNGCKSCFRGGPSAKCPANYGKCSDYSSCSTCTQDPACGWYYVQGFEACTEGGPMEPCGGLTQCSGRANNSWHYGPKSICPANAGKCNQHSNCMACTRDPACGWNAYTHACMPGDKHGSCDLDTRCGGSASRDFYWKFGETAQCPKNYGNCAQYSNCMSCTSDPTCGWNMAMQTCYSGDKYGSCTTDTRCTGTADNNFNWQFGEQAICPKYNDKCQQYSNCMSCTSDPACGWNTPFDKCQEGDQYGPCQDTPLCGGSSSKSFYWQYGSRAQCPRNYGRCNQYSNCMSCASDPACGWNVMMQQCVSGDKYGACSGDQHCSGAADTKFYWQYGSNALCPARHQTCAQHSTCDACTADSSCGWDKIYNQCFAGDSYGPCSGGSGVSSAWTFSHC